MFLKFHFSIFDRSIFFTCNHLISASEKEHGLVSVLIKNQDFWYKVLKAILSWLPEKFENIQQISHVLSFKSTLCFFLLFSVHKYNAFKFKNNSYAVGIRGRHKWKFTRYPSVPKISFGPVPGTHRYPKIFFWPVPGTHNFYLAGIRYPSVPKFPEIQWVPAGTQYPGTHPCQKQNQNYNVKTWGHIQICDFTIQ